MTIKSITGGVGIIVNGGQPTPTKIDMSAVGAGMTRYNGDKTEVFDGTAWKPLNDTDCNIDLSQPVIDLLSWVREKMKEEELRGGASAWSPEAMELLAWVKQKKTEEELNIHNDETAELLAWVKAKKQEDDILARKRQEQQAYEKKIQELKRFEEEEKARRAAEEQRRLQEEEQRRLVEEQRLAEEERNKKNNSAILEELAKQSLAKSKKKKKSSKEETVESVQPTETVDSPVEVSPEDVKPESNEFIITIPKVKPPEERMW